MIVSSALLCLAINLYEEARSEPIMAQYAVAMVTLNRAKQNPEKVCEVVFKPKQFSWTIKGAKRVGQGWQVRTPKEQHAWWLAQKIAKQSLTGMMPDFTKGSTHYHADYVSPKWRVALRPTRQFGRHLFYTAA